MLSRMSSSSVSRLLAANDLQPHKVRYYLERRDPDFDAKQSEVTIRLTSPRKPNPIWRVSQTDLNLSSPPSMDHGSM